MGFSSHKCTNCLQPFFCLVSPACKNVCNYSSITHVDTMCTERDFTQQRRYFCGVRDQEGKCLQKCKSVHWFTSGIDLHQLSLITLFFNVLSVNTLSKARGKSGKETMLPYNYSPFLIQATEIWQKVNILIPKKTTKPLFSTEPCLNLFSFSDSQLLLMFCTTKMIITHTLAMPAQPRSGFCSELAGWTGTSCRQMTPMCMRLCDWLAWNPANSQSKKMGLHINLLFPLLLFSSAASW